MAENEDPGAPPPERPRAVRLTIAYEGDRMELVAQQSVAMKVPPSDPVEGGPGPAGPGVDLGEPGEGAVARTGFWVDVKDAEDRTLYRRVMHEPIRRDVEVFSPEPRQTVQRAPLETAEPRGVFTVVLPEIEAAQAVSLIGPRPQPAEPTGPATPAGLAKQITAAERAAAPVGELARFELRPRAARSESSENPESSESSEE